MLWAVSSAVRAPVLQTGGRRFKSSTAHLKLEVDKKALEFIREKGGGFG